ncbi:leucine--tRNA ligase [Orientia chuto str. Dubai]|uniref:Leucine--tRNA ligase n=1 Tax=Orientia chuto str. Dubai TaxID=1359168 RepID=A0A0F3MM98_9RICK|nr:leucine--tRNA ligase [Candidatus Orientia mediorientalis]KJV56903.1 leucine--tRNA ligase [Orientia chuto str. Dubai]
MDFLTIEKKWQNIWAKEKVFNTSNNLDRPKYYILEMFPYPSGKIHVGHLRNYTIGDVIARFKHSQGYNILHPMGWDAFGLPAENAAMQNNTHPNHWVNKNIETMKSQLKAIGLFYDWNREVITCSPEYYVYEQKFFLEMMKKGLVYQKESLVNWDPVDQTVLANEQVVNGRGWRSGAVIEYRNLKQWFIKITNYADALLNGLDKLISWPESVKTMQKKWIGKSTGVNIDFQLKGIWSSIKVFSTKPETLFGASFIALSYNHHLIQQYVNITPEIQEFLDKCYNTGTSNINFDKMDKIAVITNLKVIHPLNHSIELPVIISNFVLTDYGTGALFGCPAHDERDHIVAKLLKLNIKQVITSTEQNIDVFQTPYVGEGIMINSFHLNGLTTIQARQSIINELQQKGIGQSVINYKLKDWGISRQRFWGCPIPIIHCQNCGIVSVPDEDLPVTLPEQDVEFTGKGNPLDNHPTWKYVKCPQCSSNAVRETDTFDTFFESSWYFARFCNPTSNVMVDFEAAKYWLPVDQYIGGIEHAIMHLLYARFITMVMYDFNYIDVQEPFTSLITQGMVLHRTYKNQNNNWLYPDEIEINEKGKLVCKSNSQPVIVGKLEKMSKSKKNIVDLESILKLYGADVVRMFVLSDTPPEKDLEWSTEGIEGCYRFLQKLYNFALILKGTSLKNSKNDEILRSKTHQTIKNVTQDIANCRLNKAIARLRELYNLVSKISELTIQVRESFLILIKLFNPFIPHLSEEIWSIFFEGEMLIQASWPKYNEEYIHEEHVNIAIQINGKFRALYNCMIDTSEQEVQSAALKLEQVKKYLANQQIKKCIFIPNKLINIII